jgi:hypothetical protein
MPGGEWGLFLGLSHFSQVTEGGLSVSFCV